MRKAILVLAIVGAGVCVWLVARASSHRLTVRTYFHNAQGLQPGALVCIDGVDVGSVRDINPNIQFGDSPIEVRLSIRTPYAIKIPADSIVSLQTDGVLGPTFVEIDTRNGSAPSITNNGVLKSLEFDLNKDAAARVLEVMGNTMLKQAQKVREEAVAPSK